MRNINRFKVLTIGLGIAAVILAGAASAASVTLLNVSYDPTREFYEEYNKAFTKHWKAKTGDDLTINQSHGGSGKQARAVIDGLDADIVTLALAHDVHQLHEKGKLITETWQSKLPHNSTPYWSTMVFLVRKGNPKGIHDWADLTKPDVSVITPNPKTSGGARWNYLAAWAYAIKKQGADETGAKEFVRKLYKNAAVLDTGARGSTVSFAERELGDVLITWENEAHLTQKEYGADQFEVVVPSFSIEAEPPVTVVDKVAKDHGTEEVAKAYLEYLYSKEAQEIAAKNYYRPRDPAVAAKYASQFPKLELVKISDPVFEGWKNAQQKHFADGGVFDQIYSAR